METQQQYEARSRQEAWRHARELETAPLLERKAAKAEFAEALRDPSLVAERISWLIEGNYGYGEMLAAKSALVSRGNVQAQLGQLVALYEWRCPSAVARAAWNALTKPQQVALARAIGKVIGRALVELAAVDHAELPSTYSDS